MSKRGVVEREGDGENEERVACPVCGVSNGPVPAEKEHRRTCHIKRKLSDKLRYDEGRPIIHSSGTFTYLVHGANLDIDGHELMDEGNADHKGEED